MEAPVPRRAKPAQRADFRGLPENCLSDLYTNRFEDLAGLRIELVLKSGGLDGLLLRLRSRIAG